MRRGQPTRISRNLTGMTQAWHNVCGVLLLDKPQGMSSNQALQAAKRITRARKAGHTGSLDPIATGLLVICLGEATKLASFLLNADKYYLTTCRLGIRTTTGDAEGSVVTERPVPHLTRTRLDAVLRAFTGTIEQVPPMYSALKHQGRRLYMLARAGIEVERAPRQVSIHALSLREVEAQALTLEIACSKGTYIRTLVEDIGEALGCGAHVVALRRLGVGPFQGVAMVTLEALQARLQDRQALEEVLIASDQVLSDHPAATLTADMAFYVRAGQPVLVPGAPSQGMVRLYDERAQFMGVGVVLDDGRVGPKRLLQNQRLS